jgi:hypothetical protein
MADEEMVAKYRDCASSVLSAEDIGKLLNMVSHLEDGEDIAEIMELLCSIGKGGSL